MKLVILFQISVVDSVSISAGTIFTIYSHHGSIQFDTRPDKKMYWIREV
jgi:hypothetical protein